MVPSCCLIFNLHYMGEGTQESVGFSQKKAVLNKGHHQGWCIYMFNQNEL